MAEERGEIKKKKKITYFLSYLTTIVNNFCLHAPEVPTVFSWKFLNNCEIACYFQLQCNFE